MSITPVDWRELYAANRAAIEGAIPTTGASDWPAPAIPVTPTARALPALRLPELGPVPAGRAPGGSGTWERLDAIPGAHGRDVFAYTPPDLIESAPAVVMLHGCTQTAASFAAGTLMNAAADRHGFVVVYPQQSRDHNQQGCWNWFTSAHQSRGGGEPAFIAAAVRAVLARSSGSGSGATLDESRVFVAGLSAGGAMASIMAATHPDLFAAAAVHSGLEYGCAQGIPAALQAMTRGGPDPEEQGRAAFRAMGGAARVVPVISLHGTADTTVCPVNGEQVLRQWMTTNALASAGSYAGDPGRPSEMTRERPDGGHAFTRRTWADASGALVQEHVEIDGMGHAWSGGAVGGSYTDPRGPGAAELVWSFFERVRPGAGRPPREPAAEPCTNR
jgi:poly(hydroxyalkanoate) depolymerase family esterase